MEFAHLHLKKAAEAWCVSGVSLNGGLLERPLCEAVKLKPGLFWRIQDVRDVRVMGYLLKGPADREWNQPKRNVCCSQQSQIELVI